MQSLKVILANLPWQRDGRWGVRAGSRWPHIKSAQEDGYLPFPFFLAYATALLRRDGIDALLVDAIAERMTEEQFLESVKGRADYLVAETSVPSFSDDVRQLEKAAAAGVSVILCGPHSAVYDPAFLKRYPFISFVLCGEYEFSLLELTRCLLLGRDLSQVQGLIYRKGSDVRKNASPRAVDINLLPWPHRENLPMERYLDTPGAMPVPSVQMLASRGCPFHCSFCLWPQVMYQGYGYRVRDVKDVVDEMEFLICEKGFKSVYFDDDTFNIGRERMLYFCDELLRRGLEKTPWAIMARPDLMDEEILRKMKAAGLWAVKYGVESADENLLRSIGKGMELKKAKEMIRLTQALGIRTHLTFTFGLPGETHRSIRKTIVLAKELNPFSLQFSVTTPFPGTAYHTMLEKEGRIVSSDYRDYDGQSRSVIRTESLNPEDLVAAKKRAEKMWAAYVRRRRGAQRVVRKIRDLWQRRQEALEECLNRYGVFLGIFNGRRAFRGPQMIQIDLTDVCNNNCLACWCNSPLLSPERLGRKRDILPTSLVKDFISEAAQMGTRELYFSGGGEPLLHPDFLEIIRHAKKHGLICTVNTNFTLVDRGMAQELIALGLDHLTVSVWAASAATYAALHPNKRKEDFARLYDMLIFLNTQKKTRSAVASAPTVKVYNVICHLNYGEMRTMLEFARLTRSEAVEFTVVDTMPGATESLILSGEERRAVLSSWQELRQEMSNQQDYRGVRVLNLENFLRRVANKDAGRAEYDSRELDGVPCYVGWLFARLMPNGDINSCLKSHRFPVGNIHAAPFRDIWNSSRQMTFREKTLSGEKNDPFFAMIGNDPSCATGCYKSCDNIGQNAAMHQKILGLSAGGRNLLRLAGKVVRF